MKVALICHVRQPIAAPFMGGMEAHGWHLADGLIKRGHDVTLFAAGDSDPRFAIDPVIDEHYERRFPWGQYRNDPALISYIDEAFARACDRIAAGGYDIVHNNSLHRFPLQRAKAGAMAMVTSLHVPPFDWLHGFVRASPAPWHRLTVTSARQMESWWPEGAPDEASVAHNGIDPAAWRFRSHGDGSAVWVGRMTPNKGPHLAITAARHANVPLTLFGTIEDGDYWAEEIAPLLDADIRYGGHLAGPALAEEVARASVFLFTPCWDEPFGLVSIEAMACGLPVAAFDRGAAREVIGQAGICVPADDVAGLAAAIPAAMAIDRRIPRARVLRHFTHDIALDRYERLYETAASARRARGGGR